MRSLVLLSAFALTLGLSHPSASAAQPPARQDQLDHALLWGRDIDQVTAIMTAKLGFQVRPGRNPDGVANRYVRLADRGYIELLGITRADAPLDPGMQFDQASLKGGPGARSFGVRSSTLDQLQVLLRGKGLEATPVFTASPNDPDGGGPTKPPRWRLFAFERPPLSSSVFFIDYAADKTDPASVLDDKLAREHPNGARELSAFWLLSANAAADREQLERMGYPGAVAVHIPRIAARGYCVPVGSGAILALQPDGAGIATDALREGGPQVLGISIGVADLDTAKRRVERGYEQSVGGYQGLWGTSFLAPTLKELGMLLEFHALSPAATKACAA